MRAGKSAGNGVASVAVDDHLPAAGVAGEQAATEIVLVEIGGNVLGVGSVLID